MTCQTFEMSPCFVSLLCSCSDCHIFLNEDMEKPDAVECNCWKWDCTIPQPPDYILNRSTNTPYKSLLENLITNVSIKSDCSFYYIGHIHSGAQQSTGTNSVTGKWDFYD